MKKVKAKKSVKKASKKPAKKTVRVRAGAPKLLKAEKPIGVITHYFSNISVAIVKFKKPVKVGVKIQLKGATTNFEETIKSMQYDHKPVAIAKKNQEVGIKVKDKVREGDEVFAA